MSTSLERSAGTSSETSVVELESVLPAAVAAVQAAGRHLIERFSPESRLASHDEVVAAIFANDAASLTVLRPALTTAHPAASWAEDELGSDPLPPGEWWVTDPVEGNINHIHGMPDWCVTATLVRDNMPELTVVYLPLSNDTYTAIQGQGAFLNGLRLHASAKTDLAASLVGTGQAKPGEDSDTYRRVGQSVIAMLERALVLRVSVPATLQLIQVAAGRMDVFWQYSQVRSGLFAGALLVAEAGGIVSDTHGRAWNVESDNFLATAPGLHVASVAVLSSAV